MSNSRSSSQGRRRLALFDAVPGLEERVPWCDLELRPSPVQPLAGLGRVLDHGGLWIKRDDLVSPLYGGGKGRKLEFLLAEAVGRESDEVIALGTTGSHQCVANAAFCRELGLRAVSAVADQAPTPAVRKNLLLGLYFGAELMWASDYETLGHDVIQRLRGNPRSYLTAPGGGTALGSLGLVEAALELAVQIRTGQLPVPDRIFIAGGSTGSAAGLQVGLELASLPTRVHVVQVSAPEFCTPEGLARLARETRELLGSLAGAAERSRVDVEPYFDTSVFAPGYAVPTQRALDARRLMHDHEGIELELCYTAKAFDALCSYVRSRKTAAANESILFWHTADARDFRDELASVDYRDLPAPLHALFEHSLPTFGLDEDYRRECAGQMLGVC